MNRQPPTPQQPRRAHLARHPAFAAVLLALATVTQAAQPLPDRGMALWLSADQGVETSEGRVVAWRDRSPSRHLARVPAEFSGPAFDGVRNAVLFSQGTLLKIDTRILPAFARQFTILAVGQVDEAPSVGLLSIRNASVPLIQLDVDENTNTRFIVRDTQSRTLSATTKCILGTRTLLGGILTQGEANRGETEVLFGSQTEPGMTGDFSSPLVDSGAWIGGLPRPGRQSVFWKGTISEILVYERALSQLELEQVADYLTAKYALKEPASLVQDTWNILTSPRPDRPVTDELKTDVCVVGAGSAGVAAALAAARQGAKVVLVERQDRLGGTGTNAYVANWEPGPGCSIAREIFERMSAAGGAGVAIDYPVQTDAAMGYNLVTEGIPYEKTLRRASLPNAELRRVPYKPETFDRVVRQMLDETGKVTILDRTIFFQTETDANKTNVESILAQAADGRVLRIRANVFIDSTGCAWLCRDLGCQTMIGSEPKSRFNEPSAPEEGSLQLNAISRCYLIRPNANPKREPAPEIDIHFPKCAFVTGWKDGLQAVNTLPLLPGRALIDFGYDECLRRSEPVVRAHWHWLQQIPEFRGYEMVEIAPMLGIRESHRVVTRYILNENDLQAGLSGQKHDDIIAVADHPCDVHGAGGHLAALKTAYGIPYRCLLPEGPWNNLMIACRGAGFSKIAASSCRLQRTMIQIGHAAGVAAAMACQHDVPVDQIDIQALVNHLDPRARYPY